MATSLVWLTGANMLGDAHPNLALSSGLSRALMLEQPSLRLTLLDVGDADLIVSDERLFTCRNIAGFLESHHSADDTGFSQAGPPPYISRFAPDLALNLVFQRRVQEESPRLAPLADQICEPPTQPPVGYLDGKLKAASINAQNANTIRGGELTEEEFLQVVDLAILIAGTMPFAGTYNASKAAVASLIEGLRLELEPFGIKVINLMTGGVRSTFLSNKPTPVLSPTSLYNVAKEIVERGMSGAHATDHSDLEECLGGAA
ncbi:hypothetical protein BJX76DRAFT_354626 [Aspergillus varians]